MILQVPSVLINETRLKASLRHPRHDCRPLCAQAPRAALAVPPLPAGLITGGVRPLPWLVGRPAGPTKVLGGLGPVFALVTKKDPAETCVDRVRIWLGWASGAGLHSLDEEVEIGAGHGGLIGAQQGNRGFLHRAHGLHHAGHGNAQAVVHLPGTHKADLLNHLGAAGEHAVGHQTQIPAVIAQALGPLLLAVGVAARGDVIRLALKQLLGSLINNLLLVVGEHPNHGEPIGPTAEVLHHGTQLAAARIAQLIICLEDQIPNDAHRSDQTRAPLYRLCRGNLLDAAKV